MSRSILSTLAFAIALAAGANAANAAGYDSGGWRDQTGYRVTQTVSYEEGSYAYASRDPSCARLPPLGLYGSFPPGRRTLPLIVLLRTRSFRSPSFLPYNLLLSGRSKTIARSHIFGVAICSAISVRDLPACFSTELSIGWHNVCFASSLLLAELSPDVPKRLESTKLLGRRTRRDPNKPRLLRSAMKFRHRGVRL